VTTPKFDLDTLTLAHGSHPDRADGLCVMEAVAWFAGQPHTDRPACVSPILTGYAMNLNDQWNDQARQQLKPFIPRLPGTAGDGADERRGYLALDWLVRTFTPAWLDLAGLADDATALQELDPVLSLEAAQAAGPVVRACLGHAAAAGDAAGAAARAAAWAAAGDAAWAAAGAVAGAAAWAVARAAARAAAWAAAGAAAGAAARDAARDAARAAARDAARAAARDAAWDAARDAARAAAGDAAWDAAGAAAGAAAWAAAGDAAWDAAGAAARAAARAAAWAAARAAAWDAAGAKLAPTVTILQASALDLLDRMIDAGQGALEA
jgi:hypothetical protein